MTTTKILYLEDDALTGLMLSELLEDLGFHDITHVTSVADAVAQMDQVKPDVGLFDLNLRGETCDTAVQKADALGVPVVLTSGSEDCGALRQMPSRHAFVQKPASPDEIAQAIRTLTS